MESRTALRSDDNSFNGTRKLVRPRLPTWEHRREMAHTEDPLTHATITDNHGTAETSHAEAFYFQKQMLQQTEMTILLEDGEQIQGVIQWYDKCTIKLRVGRSRILVYKSAIKYLYKTSDAHTAPSVMK
ncbi:MAG: RNA chaperone Hfq [Acidobacteriaceae bacterium]